MNKKQLVSCLERKSHRSRAEAADAVDNLVYNILKDLRTEEPKLAEPQQKPVTPPAKQKSDSKAGKGKQ